jgi:hypothetical protein
MSSTSCALCSGLVATITVRGFWAAIVNSEPVVNLPEHAARDQKLLIGLTRRYLETI